MVETRPVQCGAVRAYINICFFLMPEINFRNTDVFSNLIF